MSRVLLLTTEPLPLPGWPTTGAGLRAWGLAQALRARGHDLKLLMPDDALRGYAPPPGAAPPTREFPPWVETFRRGALADDPRLTDGDVIVLQHWGLADELGEPGLPLAIDLAGPHLLERRLWGSTTPELDVAEKLGALRKADFVTAGGRRQQAYFLPYLRLAGWEIDDLETSIPVVPFSLRPESGPAPPRPARFLYGGYLLPWQDPTTTLEIVLEELGSAGRGELVFVGGPHPRHDVSGGGLEPLIERLRPHPNVRLLEPMSYDAYVALLREGGVALDLMRRNAERQLAFTTRTVQYLACGLPVVHDDYSELGELIARHGGGWTFSPDDEGGVRRLIRGLLQGEIDPTRAGRAALDLVAERLDWEKTIAPLDAFCRQPRERPGKIGTALQFEAAPRRLAELEGRLARAEAQLATLRGKRWVRWGVSFSSLRGWAAWLLAPAAALIGLILIPVFLLNDLIGRRR